MKTKLIAGPVAVLLTACCGLGSVLVKLTPSTTTVHAGDSFTLSVDLITTTEQMLGDSYQVNVNSGGSGQFLLTARSLSLPSAWDLITGDATAFNWINQVLNPTNAKDLGATNDGTNPLGPGTVSLGVLTVQSLATVPPGTYTFTPVGLDVTSLDIESYADIQAVPAVVSVVSMSGTLTGTVILNDWAGDNGTVLLTVQLHNVNDHTTNAYTRPLNGSGQFTVPDVASGTYDVRVKASHWLSQLQTGVGINSDTTIPTPFSLINGDCDGDDNITASDMSIVITAMDSAPGDMAWDGRANLDGDNETIGSTDFSIVLKGL